MALLCQLSCSGLLVQALEYIPFKPHTVPNVLFATFEQRHRLRMFFPNLKTDNRTSVVLTEEELTMLYDTAIRPTAHAIVPDSIHDWPTSFQAARFRDRNDYVGFGNSAVIIRQSRFEHFNNHLRNLINHTEELKWARDFFWGTEIRGVKDSNTHDISSSPAICSDALDQVTHLVNTTNGTWYIDVGLEFILANWALLWSTHSHSMTLAEAVGITHHEADSIISNARRYTKDVSMHLMTLSGF